MPISLIISFVGMVATLCGLLIAVVVHLIKFTSLITSLQKDNASLAMSLAELKAVFREELAETKEWRLRIQKDLYKPSFKRTYPPAE